MKNFCSRGEHKAAASRPQSKALRVETSPFRPASQILGKKRMRHKRHFVIDWAGHRLSNLRVPCCDQL